MNVLEAMDLAKAGKRVRRRRWPAGVHMQFLDLNTTLGGYVVRMYVGTKEVDLPSGYLRVCVSPQRAPIAEIERWEPEIDDMEAQDWEVVGDPHSPAAGS